MIKIPHLKQFEDFYRERLLEQIEQDRLDNPTFRENFNLKFSFSYLFQKDKNGVLPRFFYCDKSKIK